MQLPSHSSRTWRLRFAVTDEPGRLAAAAAALADLGVNIVNLDVHVVSATEVIDEATVSLPAWLDVPALEHALHRTGATDVWAAPIPVRQLEDNATRVLRLAAGVIAARADDRSLSDAIAELIDAELVSSTCVDPALAGGVASSASQDRVVRFGREHVKRLPSRGGAWTMAVPDDHVDRRRVVMAARRSSPFTSTDAARTQALLQLCAAGDVQQPNTADAADPQLRIGPLTPAHLADIEDLHRRCSATSRYARYFSPMPTIRRDVIAPLLDAAHGRTSLGAWLDDRLVGMANACPVRGQRGSNCSELAALVEDAHQGRGIGTSLVRELVASTTRRGTDEFVVVTLPDNQAMIRIVHRLAHDIRMDSDTDAVTLSFPAPAPAHATER